MTESQSELEQALSSLPDDKLDEIIANLQDGASTPAEALGFDEAALNTLEATALGYYRARHLDKAAMAYGFVLRLAPDRATAWRGLGACCQSQKSFEQAKTCYNRAIEANPDDPITKIFLGECLCQLGETEPGLTALEEAVEVAADDASLRAYVTRAKAVINAKGGIPARVVLMNQGKALAAEASEVLAEQGFYPVPGSAPTFDPDRELSPDDIIANPALKDTFEHLKQALKDGSITFKEVGGFTDNELNGAYACACRYAEMDQVLEAMQIIGYLMCIDPYDARFQQLAGICLQRMKQYEAADHFYKMAHLLDPNDPMTLIYHGEASIMSGSIDDGLEKVRKGIALAEGKAEHHDLLQRGKVLEKQFGA